MYGQATIKDGRVQEQNYNSQRLLTMRETPPIEVILVHNEGRPFGVGEAGVPGVAPALTNAIFAATGERIRRLPILAHGLRLA